MKRSLLLIALSSLVSTSAFAQADLAKAKNCMACHAVASKLVGPAFKDVAVNQICGPEGRGGLSGAKGPEGQCARMGASADAAQRTAQRRRRPQLGKVGVVAEMSRACAGPRKDMATWTNDRRLRQAGMGGHRNRPHARM
jgi:hypothetical protein